MTGATSSECDKVLFREDIVKRFHELKRLKNSKSSNYPQSIYKTLTTYQRNLEDIYISGLSNCSFACGASCTEHPLNHDIKTLIHNLGNQEKSLSPPILPTVQAIAHADTENHRLLYPYVLSPNEELQADQLLEKRDVLLRCATEQISYVHLSRLQPGLWINDEIINFYCAMIVARSDNERSVQGSSLELNTQRRFSLCVRFFNTYFWHKITQFGYHKGQLFRWTKTINIFSQDLVLIPVNLHNNHWSAAAINFRLKRFEFYDSIRNHARQLEVIGTLRFYVNHEHLSKTGEPFDFNGWKDWAPLATPQQDNNYDCGIFTCQYFETISRGHDFFDFTQRDMLYFRKRMILEIGNVKLYNHL